MQKIFKTSAIFQEQAHCVAVSVVKTLAKCPFLQPHHRQMKPWIKLKPHYDEAQLLPLSAIVRIDPGDWKLLGNNQSMYDLVFSVNSNILVSRSRGNVTSWHLKSFTCFLNYLAWLALHGRRDTTCNKCIRTHRLRFWVGRGRCSDYYTTLVPGFFN